MKYFDFSRLFSCRSLQEDISKKEKHKKNNNNIININNINDDNNPFPICVIDYGETTPFIPPITEGQVVKVYDGDTITIATKLPYPESPLYRFQVRLNGIDCPEIKGKTDDERAIAQLAKKEVEELTMYKMVTLKNIGNEKFGRVLADVYVNDVHLNQYLIMKKLAVAYDGGTKKTPQSWVKYHFTGQSD